MRQENEKSRKNTYLYSSVLPVNNQVVEQFFSLRPRSQAPDAEKSTNWNLKSILFITATFALLFGGVYAMYVFRPEFEALHLSRLQTTVGAGFIALGIALMLFKLGFFSYILVLFFRYKPVESVVDEELPMVTVIVPAYNEGRLVWSTLTSLADSNYPKEKIQLISIDDGSVDDTWAWMEKAKIQLGDRLEIYQQSKNMGKRQALYRGFKLGTGDIFVTVDSDSIVEKDTLRNLVSPFVKNARCGAVAGNVKVLNSRKAIIPRMLNVSFTFSFEFIRSAQSVIGSVLCTPGALAGYRKEAVMDCLDEWMAQTFMGKKSDIGEDRAMTNMILKQGYHVLFQSNACVLTNIPENYKSLYKMFIRWERSNVRENISMASFVFKPFRKGPKSGTRILLINQLLRMLMSFPALIFMVSFFALHPILFTVSTLFAILLVSSVPAIFYAKRFDFKESFWAFSYSIFYAFGLFWIAPYALATAGKSGWLTRDLPAVK